jgi:hypothetical protein
MSTDVSTTSPPPEPDPGDYLTARLLNVRATGHRIPDEHFGYPTPEELNHLHAHLGAAIRDDVAHGATVHRRLPWPVRQVPWIVAVLDCAVLLSFCADIFNVDPTAPLQAPVASLAALLLAVLGSGVAFTWLATTGSRLRTYRNKLGEIEWAAAGTSTWILLAVSGVLVVALATLMNARVSVEVAQAFDDPTSSGAAGLGLVFAVLSAVANLAVLAVHAFDGSWLSAELARAGRLLHRHEKRTRPPARVA